MVFRVWDLVFFKEENKTWGSLKKFFILTLPTSALYLELLISENDNI